jgi:hypothetical protein
VIADGGGPFVRTLVIDAGALELVDYSALDPQSCILTPHAGELARLLDRFGKHFDLDYEVAIPGVLVWGLLDICLWLAENAKVVLLNGFAVDAV